MLNEAGRDDFSSRFGGGASKFTDGNDAVTANTNIRGISMPPGTVKDFSVLDENVKGLWSGKLLGCSGSAR